MEKQPILSICIPIYNRLNYLEMMLERFLEDYSLFQEDIHLFISDNCSEQNLKACIENFQEKGLKIDFNRNETNIGPDKNFELCFKKAEGRFTWLLGSDDIPLKGVVARIVGILKQNPDLGLFHLYANSKKKSGLELYSSNQKYAEEISHWFTFMSANIFRTSTVEVIDFEKYRKTFLIQVPVFVSACLNFEKNAILYECVFEDLADSANNGGYNLFKVFITNFHGILNEFVSAGKLSNKSFEQIKKKEFKELLSTYVANIFILKKKHHFDLEDNRSILMGCYGKCPYFYTSVIYRCAEWMFWETAGIARDIIKGKEKKV